MKEFNLLELESTLKLNILHLIVPESPPGRDIVHSRRIHIFFAQPLKSIVDIKSYPRISQINLIELFCQDLALFVPLFFNFISLNNKFPPFNVVGKETIIIIDHLVSLVGFASAPITAVWHLCYNDSHFSFTNRYNTRKFIFNLL